MQNPIVRGRFGSLAILTSLALAWAGCDSKPRELVRDTGSPDPAASGQFAACVNCHGEGSNAAPPKSTSGATSTTEIAVGAHAAHVNAGRLRPPIPCAECHLPVTDLTHMDGDARVTFGPLASANGATPAWNRAAPSCATTYCHGATLSGGTNVTPVWTKVDGTQASCGSCHGLPPPPPHVASNACGSCHAGYTATSVDPAKHIDGIVQVAGATGGGGAPACGSCHSIPPPPPHVASTSCGNCHSGFTSTSVNAALHQNGRVDVATAGGGTPACGSCHSIPPPAPHTTSTSCGNCHSGYTSTSVNTALHQNGTVDLATTGGGTPACGSCHSIPPPAPHTTSTSCGNCHSGYTSTSVNTALHQNGTVDVLAQSCTSCHGLPPTTGEHQRDDHVNRSCGDCHPGYTRTSANQTLHQNGTPNVGNRITSYNRETVTCTNSCHENEEWR